jgi:hypothetical protein
MNLMPEVRDDLNDVMVALLSAAQQCAEVLATGMVHSAAVQRLDASVGHAHMLMQQAHKHYCRPEVPEVAGRCKQIGDE